MHMPFFSDDHYNNFPAFLLSFGRANAVVGADSGSGEEGRGENQARERKTKQPDTKSFLILKG